MSTEFVNAINAVSEVLMFENWLRFYFITEEGDKLFIRVPETAETRIREEYPHLFGLLEARRSPTRPRATRCAASWPRTWTVRG